MLRLWIFTAALVGSGCFLPLAFRAPTLTVPSNVPGVDDPATPPIQDVGPRFAWPVLAETSVEVHQLDMIAGKATRKAVDHLTLLHNVRPGGGTVSLLANPGSQGGTDVRPFELGITRDGRLLDPEAASTRPAAAPGSQEDFGYTSGFVWMMLVDLWNARTFRGGQTARSDVDFWDERFGHVRFTVDVTPVAWEPCNGPGGWCTKLKAVFTPDGPTLTTIVASLIDRSRARSEDETVRDARDMAFEVQLLAEPDTLVPHRLDVLFRTTLIMGPAQRSSMLGVQKKLTMSLVHTRRSPPPPAEGPQEQPRRRVPGSGQQVFLPKKPATPAG